MSNYIQSVSSFTKITTSTSLMTITYIFRNITYVDNNYLCDYDINLKYFKLYDMLLDEESTKFSYEELEKLNSMLNSDIDSAKLACGIIKEKSELLGAVLECKHILKSEYIARQLLDVYYNEKYCKLCIKR